MLLTYYYDPEVAVRCGFGSSTIQRFHEPLGVYNNNDLKIFFQRCKTVKPNKWDYIKSIVIVNQ